MQTVWVLIVNDPCNDDGGVAVFSSEAAAHAYMEEYAINSLGDDLPDGASPVDYFLETSGETFTLFDRPVL